MQPNSDTTHSCSSNQLLWMGCLSLGCDFSVLGCLSLAGLHPQLWEVNLSCKSQPTMSCMSSMNLGSMIPAEFVEQSCCSCAFRLAQGIGTQPVEWQKRSPKTNSNPENFNKKCSTLCFHNSVFPHCPERNKSGNSSCIPQIWQLSLLYTNSLSEDKFVPDVSNGTTALPHCLFMEFSFCCSVPWTHVGQFHGSSGFQFARY